MLAEMLLPSAMSTSRWSWRRPTRTMTAIRPADSFRHRDLIFLRRARISRVTVERVAVDSGLGRQGPSVEFRFFHIQPQLQPEAN